MRIPAPHSYALERTESDPSARTADHRTKHASFGGGPRRRMFTTNWYAATPTAAHRAAAKRSCATFPKERGEDGVELSLGRTWRVRLGLARCSGLGNGSDSAACLAGPDAAWMVRGVSTGPPVRAHRFRPASRMPWPSTNKCPPLAPQENRPAAPGSLGGVRCGVRGCCGRRARVRQGRTGVPALAAALMMAWWPHAPSPFAFKNGEAAR